MNVKSHQFLKMWSENAYPYMENTLLQDFPTLQVVLPDPEKSNRAAVIILPGGGYANLANHEGVTVAEWLAEAGFTAFVLAYRRGPEYPFPIPLIDAQRAIRFVRSQAEEWQIEADKIGILGFSAGGHLASTIANHFAGPDPSAADPIDSFSDRPDFQVLIYPVITMGKNGHERSRINLIGTDPTQDLIEKLSNEKQVTAKTPPAFLFHSTGDKSVDVINSDNYVESLQAAGIPVKYIRGDLGAHGIGVHPYWADECIDWLQAFVKDPSLKTT